MVVRNNQVESMLTISEVAQSLNVHINTVRRWSNQGLLKAYRIGSRGDRRYRQQDIENFLAHERNPKS
ncbi:MAG: helix-turn-helix domain-containing protein [Chloroflexi bacterium]|nr:helix-turn-helix domain-containing protein [Chloroflexota bacterium]